jgi:PhnB protein
MSDEPIRSGITAHITIVGGTKEKSKAKDAIAFYKAAFGADVLFENSEEAGDRLMHGTLAINGSILMLNDDFPEMRDGKPMAPPSGCTLTLEVGDADAVWQRACDAGAQVHFPLDNQFWGQRYGQLRDPFGHIWAISGPVTG